MSRMTRALVIATLACLAIAGCVRYEADITLDSDNTASGDVVFAVATEVKDRLGVATDAEALHTIFGNISFGSAFEKMAYEDAEFVGERYVFESVTFAELGTFGDLFTVSREGDTMVVTGIAAPAADPETDDPVLSNATATLRIEFPGPVTEHNGRLSGNTVTWDLMTQTEPIMATSTVPSDDGLKQALVGGLIAAASATVLAAIIILIQRRRAVTASERVAEEDRDADARLDDDAELALGATALDDDL